MAERTAKDERNLEEKKATRKMASPGDGQAGLKEDEGMQKNQDPDTGRTTQENAAEKPVRRPARKPAEKAEGNPAESSAAASAEKPAERPAPPRKKNIIGVFRPQNSKTGMVKPGSRPRPDGSRPASSRPASSRPQSASGARPASSRPLGQGGTRPASSRPQNAMGARPAGTSQSGPTGQRVASSRPLDAMGSKLSGSRVQNAAGTRVPGTKPQDTESTRVKSEDTAKPAGSSADTKPAGSSADTKPAGPAGAKPAAGTGTSPSAGAEAKPAAGAGAKPAGSTAAKPAAGTGAKPAAAAGAKPAGSTAAKPAAGTGAKPAAGAGAKPAGSTAARSAAGTGTKPAAGAGTKPAGAAGARASGGTGTKAAANAGTKPAGTAGTRSAGGAGARTSGGAGTKPAGAAGARSAGSAGARSAGSAGTRPAGGTGERSANASGTRQAGSAGARSAGTPGTRGQGGARSSADRRSQENRSGQAGYARGQEGRNGRGAGYAKSQPESKPMEKESRKRSERGDRNRDKGDKLDRLEKNARPGQKANQKNSQKNSQKGGMKKNQAVKAPAPKPAEKPADTVRTITLPEKMTVGELASALKVTPSALIKKLLLQGMMVTVNEEVDFDKAEEIALEYNCICEKEEKVDVIAELLKEEEESEEAMTPRPPVVCVMGHVDHGKTSLLDAIRNTHEIDKEAGGITQHIGAYMASINGQKITFLDTPGHEAFTAMRMRGANSTDIAILVVAADDGVMPQTIEAINHAKAAGIEIIVAINKIDKPSANVERVKQELSEQGLVPEDWGGNTVVVPVSAHTHEGIDNLLEMVLLTAEVLELKANPNRKARGIVIEAELDKGKGSVATVLVQKGTLHVGDPIAAGSCYGKVRAMMDENGRRVREAVPSTPVEILGLSDVPNAGDIFVGMDTEKDARNYAETFYSEGRKRMIDDTKLRMSLDDLYSQIQAGKLKELDLIIKADVQGSVEAVKQSLLKLSNDEVVVKVIHSGVGAINESDVILASASNAIIIGFNIRPDAIAREMAEREGVDVRLYRVIYDAIADVEAAMKGMLDPIYEEKVIGHAEIRQLFKASSVGMIGGSYVTDGVFQRSARTRILREGEQIFEGPLASLKRFKDDVKEVKAGYECGLVFEKFNDIRVGDMVEAYVMVEVPR